MPLSSRTTAPFAKTLLYGLAGLLFAVPCGCRSARDNQIDLLERELRSQEDYIYELEDYVVEYSEKLRACRCAQPHETIIFSEPKQSEPANKRRSNKTKRSTQEVDQVQTDKDDMPDSDDAEQREPPLPEAIIPEELDVPELEISEPLGRSRLGDPLPGVIDAVHEAETPGGAHQVFIPDPADFVEESHF
ncbi:MAG: hypothetical protein MI725_09525, partial [Pirellulales bacterium]|nr:hypothetical protein [Pirellulales bacterium]